MRTGLAISGVGHAAVLLWSVVTFAANPFDAPKTESMPVDIISENEFSQLTSGARNAPKLELAKPLVDKIGEIKPVEDPLAKLANKEVKAAIDTPAPPVPPTPPEPPAKKPPQPKSDPIADALQKPEPKKPEPKKADVKPPPPPVKKPPQPAAPAFDPRQVEALLDKRIAQRLDSTGAVVNTAPALGAPSGTAAMLSQGEMDALRARLAQLWSPPAGAKNPQELVVVIRIKLKRDGTLEGGPQVLTSGTSPLFMAARDSAVRALFRGQPFNMLKPEHYDQWNDMEITFDPRDMLRS
jgi:outer membrane biosynthesis protein TonB